MSVIHEIMEKLKVANKPVAKPYFKNDHTTVIFIGFNEGMTLETHKTNIPAKLLVLTGKVVYKQGGEESILNQYETKVIPVDILHEVYAVEDSLCILIKG